MKIAMVHTPFMTRTGGERQVLMLALELQKLGHQVEIFTNYVDQDTYPELFSKLEINVVPIGRKSPKHLAKADALSMIMLARKITKGFDVINNHNFPTEVAAFLAKKRLKIPVVWMCNEPPFWYLHPEQREALAKLKWPVYSVFEKLAVKQIDEILALSNLGAKTIREVYNRESRVVRSGVNVDFFHNASGNIFRKRNGLENDFVLLQVGTLVYYKRQVDSIAALAMLSKKHDNVKLVLDGFGNPKFLMDLAEKLGVQDKIIFSHASSDDELATIYAACDAFVYPSDNTWGLVVTEAMAASKPIIVSKKSGAAEIIQDNITGFVVNHEKPIEIADRLEILINNPKLTRDIGNNCYHYVKENLSWEKYAKSIEKIFYNTIEYPTVKTNL
jgi:glycosyltransferase involved in cell wall biosynthesis